MGYRTHSLPGVWNLDPWSFLSPNRDLVPQVSSMCQHRWVTAQCSSATPTSARPATVCTPAVSSSLPGGCEGLQSHLALPRDPGGGAAACPDPVSLLPAQCSRMGLSPSRDPGLSRQRACSGSERAAHTTTTRPVQGQSRTGGTPGPTRPIPKGRKNPNRTMSIWSSPLVLMEAVFIL